MSVKVYEVNLAVWVLAESPNDAETIAGEHFGMNLPPEIPDYLLQGASEDETRDDLLPDDPAEPNTEDDGKEET